jgi:hypothetical protein
MVEINKIVFTYKPVWDADSLKMTTENRVVCTVSGLRESNGYYGGNYEFSESQAGDTAEEAWSNMLKSVDKWVKI